MSTAIEEAKCRLRMQEIAGIANRGREGLGLTQRHYYSSSSDREKRGLIGQQIRVAEEERRMVKVSSLAKQAASMKWEVETKVLKDRDIMTSSESRLKFVISSVYDLLATPANKNLWYRTEEFKCALCDGVGTMNHIFSGCKIALSQGRYTWRHNKVLQEIAYWIDERRKQVNKEPYRKRKWIQFVKNGSKSKPSTTAIESYLSTARDWKLETALESKLKVPANIVETN